LKRVWKVAHSVKWPSREHRNGVAKDYQIGGWLRRSEKDALQEYLKQFGIRPAAAATLLIVRELRCKRLPKLKERYAERIGPDRSRLTAHQPDGKLKEAFTRHAAAFGLDPNPAASILFRAELEERWLENALESA
jgi:hypothetical protein